MNYYSYLIEHDFGLAPNPFGGYCTLAVCKPQIRNHKRLQKGDWIIGTGSKALEDRFKRIYRRRLIYAMEVAEIIPMEEYWDDIRFQCKKPIINGSLPLVYGDNFYHKDELDNWFQEDSAHSNYDGSPNLEHLKTDISGKHILISNKFYYFGQACPSLPKELYGICHKGIGHKILTEENGVEFVSWLTSNYKNGIYGDPIDWQIYDQLTLF